MKRQVRKFGIEYGKPVQEARGECGRGQEIERGQEIILSAVE
jgi:hypothetical protein